MTTRRDLLAGLATLPLASLTACTEIIRAPVIDSASGAIDIHAHIFNGLDIPRTGFLQQVILRDPHSDTDPNVLTGAFIKLLTYILLSNTPTAADELRELTGTGLERSRSDSDPLADDQQNVSEAIAAFNRDQARQETSGLTRSKDRAVIDLLYKETGLTERTDGLASPEAEAARIAAEIYAPASGGAGLTRSTRAFRINKSAVVQTIRWAGLLTRSREDIYDELVKLYGGADGIAVYSPSIVDFQLWFKTDEKVTPGRDLIDVMSALARRRQDAVLLNFAAFCPLRAALRRQDNPGADPLADLKYAIERKGFAGVKLYPPVGFKPIGNEGIPFTFAKRIPSGGGAALDRELRGLYAWCADNDVPLKSHANNSIEADVCSGLFASPLAWKPVLEEFGSLRLNLAHFGGFDETGNAPDPLALSNRCVEPSGRDWENLLADMLSASDGLFFDLGYWIETSDGGSERARVLNKMRELIDREPLVADRMMYGSDWSMIGRETSHPVYRNAVLDALGSVGLSVQQRNAVESGNAWRYLGLHREGPQKRRLDAFFGEHPVWRKFTDRN